MTGDDSRIAVRSRGGAESSKGLRGKLVLTAGDVRDLYETSRSLGGMGGAPYLNRLFDAASALDHGHVDRAEQIISRTRQEFEKSHIRLLRFSPGEAGDRKKEREDARLAAKKVQVEEVLGQFDAYLAVLERMRDVGQRRGVPAVAAGAVESTAAQERGLPVEFVQSFQAEESTDGQAAVVDRHFTRRPVASAADILPDSLYFLRTRSRGFVLRTSPDLPRDEVHLTDVITGKPVRPQRTEDVVEQGQRGKFFALAGPEQPDAADQPREQHRDAVEPASADPLEAQNELLDRQLFNVLMLAVKQSGLKVSTDLIVQVRDNEFRKGQYHDAFEKLNQLATRYEMLAARRKEALRQHDQWLSSGQSGLSMREVELAKLANANERSRLEHASHRFGLVVEPLRILARGT